MKIIGNTLETIHKFRHGHVSKRWLDDPFLTSTVALGANRNIKLQLLYLDTNDTFYLVESTSSMLILYNIRMAPSVFLSGHLLTLLVCYVVIINLALTIISN